MLTAMDTRDKQEELVKRAQRGDSDAFEILLRECQPELGKYVRARIGEHLQARLEPADVEQETCTKAWASIGQLRWTGRDTFVRWLKGIARHVILQQADREGRGELLHVELQPPSREVTPSRGLRREERFDRLQSAIDGLQPDYREAIMLVRVRGLQIKEAARRMGRTPKAVTHLLARALTQLRSIVGDTESLQLPPRGLAEGEHHEP